VYVCELTKRTYRTKDEVFVTGPEVAYKFLKDRFRHGEEREHFVILLLSARHAVIGVETISIGSLNASIVHPREVFRPAITQAAAGVILAHNHPRETPSRRMTI